MGRPGPPSACTAFYAMAAILALGLGLRLYSLGHTSYWVNELWAVLEMQKPFGQMLREMDFRQPPLYFFYIYPYRCLAGDGEAILRLPSAAMGVCTIWLVYLLGARLFTRMEGLLAAFFLAVSPAHIDLSQDIRQYAPWVMWSVCASIYLLKALDTPTRRNFGLYLLFSLLMCYTQYLGIALVLSHFFFLATVQVSRGRGRGGARLGEFLVRAWIPFLLLTVPAFILIRCSPDQNAPGGVAAHVPLPTMGQLLAFANEMATGWSLRGPGTRILVLQFVVIGLGIAGLSRRFGRGVMFLCMLYAGLFVFISAILYAMDQAPGRRYFFILTPVCATLFASGIVCLGDGLAAVLGGRGKRLRAAAPTLMAACFSIVPLSALPHYYRVERHDTAGVARFLERETAAADLILLRQHWAFPYLAHYYPGIRDRRVDGARDLAEIERVASGYREGKTWVVYYHLYAIGPEERGWLERHARCARTFRGRELSAAIWRLNPDSLPAAR